MSGNEHAVQELAALELFSACDRADLASLAAQLDLVEVTAGEVVMRQGEPAEWFALVVDGAAEVEREVDGRPRSLGVATPGSIVGELALARGTSRSATVRARDDLRAYVGDRRAFGALLDIGDVRHRVARIATQKLAAQAEETPVTLPRGNRFLIRPLLPSDRDEVAAGIGRLSEESRRRRFFTAGAVPSRLIDYLVDIDYVDHFAWVAFPGGAHRPGAGVSRYVRDQKDPTRAEFAVAVVDAHHRQGLGSLLLGCLAPAAQVAGIEEFTGEVLDDNRAIRALLDRSGATWTTVEPGILEGRVPVAAFESLITPDLAARLRGVATATTSVSHVLLA